MRSTTKKIKQIKESLLAEVILVSATQTSEASVFL